MEKTRNDDICILSPHGDATLHPKAILTEELLAPYDLILLSVKAYALEEAINDFSLAVDRKR